MTDRIGTLAPAATEQLPPWRRAAVVILDFERHYGVPPIRHEAVALMERHGVPVGTISDLIADGWLQRCVIDGQTCIELTAMGRAELAREGWTV